MARLCAARILKFGMEIHRKNRYKFCDNMYVTNQKHGDEANFFDHMYENFKIWNYLTLGT
jgi:hypothetical protein